MALSSSLNLRLGIDVSNLSKELSKVERSLSRFGSQMENIGSRMSQSFTLPIIALGTASLRSFADLEKLNKGLVAIMGSSELAGAELERLREVAKLPGLGLKEAVEGSINLQAVGLSADEARNTLMGFGQALAATGKGKVQLESIQYQLTQMIPKNKILAEDYKVIQSNLPLMAEGMQLAFGTKNIESIKQTGISAKDFTLQLSAALAKLPQTQNVTGGLANSMENLSDNLFIAAADLGDTINKTLGLEKVFENISNKVQRLVEGFKSLNPETQGFIVKAALFVAAIGPAFFVIGKMVSGIAALVGVFKNLALAIGIVNKAFMFLAANPYVLAITAIVAALGALAFYVYDNWEAFKDLFANLWIDIKNIVISGINGILSSINKVQKFLGVELFDSKSLEPYQKEQKVVAAQFKTIGQTVDSLKGKLSGLFTNGAKKSGSGIVDTITEPTGENSGVGAGIEKDVNKIDKKLFNFDEFKTLNDLQKAKEELNKSVVSTVAPKLREQLGLTENGIVSLKKAGEDVIAFGERLKTNAPNLAKPFTDAEVAILNFKNTLADAVIAATDAFSTMAIQGETDMKKLGSAALSAARTIISAYIKEGVAGIVKNILAGPTGKVLGPVALAVAGAAGAGASVLFNSLINKVAAPKLAQGGLAYAPTMAMVGDNRNARVDPEVIAPLSKLKSMMGDMGIGGTLETRISGNDLLILLNRSGKGLSRVQ